MENYFNYFTEIEDCFRRQRGTPRLLSTLDWALIESWKEAGIPLDAVLTGIERAFENFAKRRQRFRKINGLAYCSQTVLAAVEELKTRAREGGARRAKDLPPPFEPEEVRAYLARNAAALEAAAARNGAPSDGEIVSGDLKACAAELERIAADPEKLANFPELESHLSALEEKLTASVTRAAPVELLAQVRQEVERELVPYRQRMSGLEIEPLQRQFLKKRLYEHHRIPRLSLFYM